MKASPPGITGTGGLLAQTALGFLTVPAAAQWSGGVGDQTSRPASYEGEFRQRYPETEALFNAFDYGSAVLFERLLTEPNPLVERLEVEIYGKLAGQVLRNAPRVPTPVQKMIPNYARLAPRANPIVTWARMLRRQIYDIYADDRITDKVVAVDEAVEHYLSRSDLALPPTPKSMAIMDDQRDSKVFGERYPKTRGLFWAYNWLQMGALDPLTVYSTPQERLAGIHATVERFREMLEDPPRSLPSHMPMAPAIAPDFVRLHPRAAAIFDNLNMMHNVIADILVFDERTTDKRAPIDHAVDQFTDPRRFEIPEMAWIEMSLRHGIWAQGSPAIGRMQGSERNQHHSRHTQGRMMRPDME